jgi:hypothetical protein
MGVEMGDGEIGDAFPERAENRISDGMAAAERERALALVKQASNCMFDNGEGLVDGERQVSGIGEDPTSSALESDSKATHPLS